MGRNSMRAGSTPEMEWAEVAKNSYCRYFKVWRQLSRMSPLYSSRMYNLTRERRDSAVLREVFFVTNQLADEWKWTMGQLWCMNQRSWSSITLLWSIQHFLHVFAVSSSGLEQTWESHCMPRDHSKMCLSTSWNASFADSSWDWAAKYLDVAFPPTPQDRKKRNIVPVDVLCIIVYLCWSISAG